MLDHFLTLWMKELKRKFCWSDQKPYPAKEKLASERVILS